MSSRGNTSLAGSLAPSAWQREIAQNTAWVNALRSTYSWTRAFTAPQPTLNNEPLLGQSLAMLTTAIAQPTQNSSEALRPTRVKPTSVQHSTNHESFLPGNNMTRSRGPKASNVTQQPSAAPTLPHITNEIPSHSRKHHWIRHTATTARTNPDWLAQIDQRVDDIRLQQWAGITTRLRPQGTTPPHPRSRQGTREGYPYHGRIAADGGSVAHGRGTPRGFPGVGFPGRGAVDDGGDSTRTQPYQHSLIEQTKRMLQHTSLPLSMNTAYQPPVGHTEQEELLLPHQWATTIGAQTAPLELLQHYATLSKQDREVVNKNGQNGRNNANALSSLPENGVPTKANTVGNSSNHAEGMQAPPTEQAHTMNDHRASNNGEQESIMPPQVAAQLPTLITSQRIDMPPLPVAAATARFGARAEMMIDEDLDVLAARIKRILDDEARRHGIDV